MGRCQKGARQQGIVAYVRARASCWSGVFDLKLLEAIETRAALFDSLVFGVITMALGMLTSGMAKKRGQPPIKWWCYGAMRPPVALVYAWLYLEDRTKKQCNFCREFVDKAAVVCPRCGHDPYGVITPHN